MSFAPDDSRSSGWWGYMKTIIRKYDVIPLSEARSPLEYCELEAVQHAIERTRLIKTGEERLRLVNMVFWKRSHNVVGAGMVLHVSEDTAIRWHSDFVKAVAREFFGEEMLKRYNKEEKRENKKFR